VSNGGDLGGGWFLKVVCKDYPRPDIDMTANYWEAAALSAFFRSAPRPTKPLNVVIAGAGEMTLNVFLAL
jgi:15-cis-phytoene desaturase